VATIYLFYILKGKIETVNFNSLLIPFQINIELLILVFLLMPLNWGIEMMKWKRLTNKFQSLSYFQAIQSILSGIFIGLLTPNRIGEVGGRLLFIRKENRPKALYVNSVCSLSQTMATLFFGMIAIIFFRDEIASNIKIQKELLLIVSMIAVMMFLYIYFRSNSLKLVYNFVGQKFAKDHTLNEFDITKLERLNVLLFSILRYVVFGLQFFLLLFILIPSAGFWQLFMAVCLIYLSATVVPTAWLSSLPVRTSFAFLIIEMIGFDGFFGLISSVLLWIINLFIPAVFGIISLKGLNFKKVLNKKNAL